jgi:hypothetical protein
MLQRLGLNPDLVQPGAQGVLVGACPRGVLGGVGIVCGVAHLIARPPPHNTQGPTLRQGLSRGAAHGLQLLLEGAPDLGRRAGLIEAGLAALRQKRGALVDAMRIPPCGPWAGDHDLDKHGRQLSLFTSPLTVGTSSILYFITLLRQQKRYNFHIIF